MEVGGTGKRSFLFFLLLFGTLACSSQRAHSASVPPAARSAAVVPHSRAAGDAFVEPICRDDPGRFALLPIRHPNLWSMYKQSEASFWTAEEVDLSCDRADWK